jgi:hypothetical protein
MLTQCSESVVADNTSAFKKNRNRSRVLQPALQAYQRLLIVRVLNPDASLEKEEKVESKVDAAEV